MREKSAVNGTSGVYSNKIPWRGSKIHLPNTELCVPNAVIVAFQSILEEQMPTIWVLQISTGDWLCLLTKWQNNLENISGHTFFI